MEISEIIQNLQEQKKLSARQLRLLALHSDEDRSPDDNVIYEVFLDAERKRQMAHQASATVGKLLAKESGVQRRTRTKTLIERGALVELAGWRFDVDPALILGALLQAHHATAETQEEWKREGQALLEERKKQKAADRQR